MAANAAPAPAQSNTQSNTWGDFAGRWTQRGAAATAGVLGTYAGKGYALRYVPDLIYKPIYSVLSYPCKEGLWGFGCRAAADLSATTWLGAIDSMTIPSWMPWVGGVGGISTIGGLLGGLLASSITYGALKVGSYALSGVLSMCRSTPQLEAKPEKVEPSKEEVELKAALEKLKIPAEDVEKVVAILANLPAKEKAEIVAIIKKFGDDMDLGYKPAKTYKANDPIKLPGSKVKEI